MTPLSQCYLVVTSFIWTITVTHNTNIWYNEIWKQLPFYKDRKKNTFSGNRSFSLHKCELEQHEKLRESHEQVSDQLWRACTSAEVTKKTLASCRNLNPHVCRNFSMLWEIPLMGEVNINVCYIGMQQELQKHYCYYKAWNKRQDQTWKLWYNRSTLLQSGVKQGAAPQYSKTGFLVFKSSVKILKRDTIPERRFHTVSGSSPPVQLSQRRKQMSFQLSPPKRVHNPVDSLRHRPPKHECSRSFLSPVKKNNNITLKNWGLKYLTLKKQCFFYFPVVSKCLPNKWTNTSAFNYASRFAICVHG